MTRAARDGAPALARPRQHAIQHSLFKPTSLPAPIKRPGFVQAADELHRMHRFVGLGAATP